MLLEMLVILAFNEYEDCNEDPPNENDPAALDAILLNTLKLTAGLTNGFSHYLETPISAAWTASELQQLVRAAAESLSKSEAALAQSPQHLAAEVAALKEQLKQLQDDKSQRQEAEVAALRQQVQRLQRKVDQQSSLLQTLGQTLLASKGGSDGEA